MKVTKIDQKNPHHCYGEESYLSKAYCRDISFTYISVISINQNKCSENKCSIFYQNIQRTKNVGAIIHETSYSLLLVNFHGNCHSVEVFGVLWIMVRLYVLFILSIMLSILRFTASDYPFSIFKLFLSFNKKKKNNKKP